MVARVVTVAFEGVEARLVDVQVELSPGNPFFQIVGLGDKAVGESRERVRAAFAGLGLALPPKRILVNLAPADMPKEGSHYDLPIALALMAAMSPLSAKLYRESGGRGLGGDFGYFVYEIDPRYPDAGVEVIAKAASAEAAERLFGLLVHGGARPIAA